MNNKDSVISSKLYDLGARAKIILKDVFEENFLSLIHIFDVNYDENFDVIKFRDRDKNFNLFIKENEALPKVAYSVFDEDMIMTDCIKYDFIESINQLDEVEDEKIRSVIKRAFEDLCYAASL